MIVVAILYSYNVVVIYNVDARAYLNCYSATDFDNYVAFYIIILENILIYIVLHFRVHMP